MPVTCGRQDCTVSQTRICLLNLDPETCPEREKVLATTSTDQVLETGLAPVLIAPASKPRFPSSNTLSPDDARKIMAKRYTQLVGVLGAPDAGKTAALVSFYLLLSHGKLKGLEYCDSKSLNAFEQISRGARRWNEGKPPAQLTNHTELPDARVAGFLHVRLSQVSKEESTDILISDLPGEWTTELINQNDKERLEFMKRADSIWLMVSGKDLHELHMRMNVLHRLRQLLERVVDLVGTSTRFTCVISWRDLAVPDEQTLERIRSIGIGCGVDLRIANIASFAEGKATASGAGIPELFAAICEEKEPPKSKFQSISAAEKNPRGILSFRDFGTPG